MIWKIGILLSVALCVLGDGHHAVSEQHIKINHKEHEGSHGELSHIGSKKLEHHEEYAWSYPSYEFSYSVHDPHTHDKKGQQESRDGDEVKGEYWLIEPDGRKRTVTYNADKHIGFNAIVHFSDYKHGDHGEEKGGDEKVPDEQEGQSEEKGQGEEKKKEENEGGNDEEATEEEAGEEGRGAEESRGTAEGVIRWGYGPKWDQSKEDSRRSVDRRGLDEGRKLDDIGSMTIIGNMGSYGRREDKKRNEGRQRDERRGGNDGRVSEESLRWEERRKFDERRGYPSHITPYYSHPLRNHPRFYKQNQGLRGNAFY